MSPPRIPLMERLFSRVEKTETCWIWKGHTNNGYGKIGVGGRDAPFRKTHVIVYENLIGPVPRGMCLDHLCRNRSCCRPDHLEPVTLQENIRRGQRANQTHCKHGHPFDFKNTYFKKNGERACRMCACIRARNRRHRVGSAT